MSTFREQLRTRTRTLLFTSGKDSRAAPVPPTEARWQHLITTVLAGPAADIPGGWQKLPGCKLVWNGDRLMVVPPQNTSRTCPRCGHTSADNRRTQARFECVVRGFAENADLVGAMNILRAGHARLAREVSGAVRPPAAGTHRSDSGAALCRA
jgi:hypothetical protein